MDLSEDTSANGENDPEAGGDEGSAFPETAEAKPERPETQQPAGESPAAFVVSVGANLGRTTRLLGKGSQALWEGTGGAIVRAARSVGASVRRLDDKRQQRMAGEGLQGRAAEIRSQICDTFREIGSEVFKGWKPESASFEVTEQMQELLSKARGLQDELDKAEQAAIQDAESKAPEEPAEAPEPVIETEGEPVAAGAKPAERELAEGGAEDRGEPKKKGRAKAKAPTESEEASAGTEPNVPAQPEEKQATEAEAEPGEEEAK